jgi:hypothetical protein
MSDFDSDADDPVTQSPTIDLYEVEGRVAKLWPDGSVSYEDGVEPSMSGEPEIIALMDDCLIAIQDGRQIPESALRQLPPWRAVLIADVAVKSGYYPAHAAAALRSEARRIGGNGMLPVSSAAGVNPA